MKVAVIGAGVLGLAAATEFSARGADVEIFDRGARIGDGACSWYAGGMLAPFCEGESAEEPVVRLGQQAADWWARHTGLVERRGSLVLALGRDGAELRRFARRTEGHESVDGDRIGELEPDLAGRFARGLHFAAEAHLDPRAGLEELARRLAAQGVAMTFGHEILPEDAEADLVLDCRGLAARDRLGDLRGVKGEMLVIRSAEIALSRPVRLLHPRIPLYLVPRGGGLYMLGATMIEAGERGRMSVRSALELLGGAYALHPAFGEAEIVEIGVDARPAFPDNLPRIRRRGRVMHLNGLYRHGFLLAPALARMAAEAAFDPACKPELMDEDRPERQPV